MNLKDFVSGFLTFIAFVVVFGFLIYGGQNFLNKNRGAVLSDISDGVINAQQIAMPGQSLPQRDWKVEELNIKARSAVSVENNSVEPDKILFEKNSETRFPIASLTKLMTAIIVLDNYNLSQNISLNVKSDSQLPVTQDLKLGDTLPVEGFLHIMLIESSNKAAYALAENVGEETFISLMNRKAKEIGLQNTFFADPTGLSSKNVSTAKDLTKLAEYILKNYPNIFAITKTQEMDLIDFGKVTNTNQLLGEIPEIAGGKTGFTNEANGCLLLVVTNTKAKDYLANDYLIYVVLGSDDRFSEMKNIINWINTAYSW